MQAARMSGVKTPSKLVIDTDPGLDDTQAILMILNCPSTRVLAFTTCHGSGNVDQLSRNLLRTLKVADKMDIPVHRGCAKSLLGDESWEHRFHVNNGYGTVPLPESPGLDLLHPEHAVLALLRLVNDHPGEISLVCLAPLSNIAVALKLDPDFGKKLKDCFIMGGNYKGLGNITPAGEFNFLADPEAARIILRQLQCPITLVAWELCVKYAIPADLYRQHFNTQTKAGQYLREIEAEISEKYYITEKGDYLTSDQILMACVMDPGTVVASQLVFCDVELQGSLTRGQMVADWSGLAKQPPNVTVVTKIDFVLYKNLLATAVL